jgi:transposase-like protein
MTLRAMVDAKASLRDVLAEADGDALRQFLAHVLAEVMDVEVSSLCGAEPFERTAERTNQRNGFRERTLETRMGTVDLRIPKLRAGAYFPSFLTPRRVWEQAFVNVVAEAYVQGVSTRAMDELVEAMGARGMSKSEVSRMAASLDGEVEKFRNRPLEKAFPYVWLDALYVKVREDGRSASRAVLVATGVAESGEREVLGVEVAQNEMEPSWRAFLERLVGRGLRGVRLLVSDAHPGLTKAVRRVLNGASWQRCYVHFLRNVVDKAPKAMRDLLVAALRRAFHQDNEADARRAYGEAIALVEGRYEELTRLLRDGEDDVLAYFAFPPAHRRQIRSTNPLERLNKELRKRVRQVGLFPNAGAVVRLLGAILREQHDEWSVAGRRYFSDTSMKELQTPRAVTMAGLPDAAA